MVKLKAGEKKKNLIIDVCKKLFYRKGYANTTYDDICKKADIPPGSITYHFRGKRDIAAVIDAEYEAQNKIYIKKMCGKAYDKTTSRTSICGSATSKMMTSGASCSISPPSACPRSRPSTP
ncbi:MAG: TetR/AcrR family transcriptional regulator [Gordonibacter pamelaeae]